MKIKKIIAALAAVALVFGMVGCKESGIDSISQNLTQYTIDATYDGANSVTASMDIAYVNNYDVSLSELKLHLYPNAFREGAKFKPMTDKEIAAAYPEGVSYGGITVTSVTRGGAAVDVQIDGQDEDILTVPFDGELKPTSTVKVHIDFTLMIPTVRHRFGKIGTTVNLGNWYPIACMYRDGAFVTDPYYASGDPFWSAASNYKVKFTVPAGLTVAATGETVTTVGEQTVVTSEAKAVRDFAAVIGEFQVVTGASGTTEVKYYYATDSDPSASLKAAVDSLDTFSEKYGLYPYKSYSVVETAFLQGGMEYPQIVYISDALAPEIYRDAIIHETAHQWFYGLVGNDQVKYPWLDEALAEYSASMFYKWRPEYNIDFEKRISDALSSFILYCELYKHGGKDDTSMRALSEYPENMEYTYMTYVKGSLMFDSLRRTIGDDDFVKSLKRYVTENYLTTAVPDNLISCFEKTSGKELKGFFDSWVGGKVMLFG